MSLRIPKPIDGWDEKVMADMPTEAGICPSPVNGILFGLNRSSEERFSAGEHTISKTQGWRFV